MRTLLDWDRIHGIIQCGKNAPEGLFAEAGVYQGGMCKILGETFPDRCVLGFDTFEGLPVEQWTCKEKHRPGDFKDTSIEEVNKFINLTNVKLVKGLFPDSGLPFENEKFALVHVDFDFYLGIKACLDWFWPRMNKGGFIVFDDYDWHMCPGVKKALDEFPEPLNYSCGSQVYIIKT